MFKYKIVIVNENEPNMTLLTDGAVEFMFMYEIVIVNVVGIKQ